jgi:menaquinone-dependent protoporphyrinogen oxidase
VTDGLRRTVAFGGMARVFGLCGGPCREPTLVSMNILVAVASRHGATREIADEIGKTVLSTMEDAGESPNVDVLFTETIASLEGYDCVILGSAVYMGHWLDSATKLAEAHKTALRVIPVWLFSSGPVGQRHNPGDDPAEMPALVADIGAREHRLFGGKIDKSAMHLPERALVTALRVKEGDYRDWPSIRAWAAEIAVVLHKTPSEV